MSGNFGPDLSASTTELPPFREHNVGGDSSHADGCAAVTPEFSQLKPVIQCWIRCSENSYFFGRASPFFASGL